MKINLDFETYSEAGQVFDFQKARFAAPPGVNKKGLFLVGAFEYAAHPSTEVLCAAYSIDGDAKQLWAPGCAPPQGLLNAISDGRIIHAWNSFFEWAIWNLVCVRRYGWPVLPLSQTYDTSAGGRAWSLPGALATASAALFGASEKDAAGSLVMKKLSQPRNPTAKDARLRYERQALSNSEREREDWRTLDAYCLQDVVAEQHIGTVVPELSSRELEVWKLDQKINARGVAIDVAAVAEAIKIVEEGKRRAAQQLVEITEDAIFSASQATAILKYVNAQNPALLPQLRDLQPANTAEYTDIHGDDINAISRQVLDIRAEAGGNATAKLYAMLYQSKTDGRARGQYQYCGAQRTRRWAGRGIQLQNLPRGEVTLHKCKECGWIIKEKTSCNCGTGDPRSELEWGIESVEQVLPSVMSGDYDLVSVLWGNPLKIIAGCLRSFLIAGPEKTLISSDYSAIEAVVMACLAGETWVIDTFFGDGKLYEHTASKITGDLVGEILEYKQLHGKHHPARRLGKVASLASQYAGGRGAWLAFGAGKFLTNAKIDEGVRGWRDANPAIVEFWASVEHAAMNAICNPGYNYAIGQMNGGQTGVSFQMSGDVMYCVLPNDEWLSYQKVEIVQRLKLSGEGWKIVRLCSEIAETPGCGAELELELKCQEHPGLLVELQRCGYGNVSALHRTALKYCNVWKHVIVYMGVGAQNKWMELETYGGKLAENIVQATARFILSEAMLRIENAGYPIVMHTHDEIVSEIPRGFGSVENFESIMSIMPAWAKLPDGRPWPIRAAGGWTGQRYRK